MGLKASSLRRLQRLSDYPIRDRIYRRDSLIRPSRRKQPPLGLRDPMAISQTDAALTSRFLLRECLPSP
jgi:hypothetical protein